MRILYYVSMIHTPQESGTLKDKMIAARRQTHGNIHTKIFLKQIQSYWKEVERKIQGAGLHRPETASRLHIFIDGLPHTDESLVKKVVEKSIGLKIPMYIIAEKLQRKGAKIHGTENVELLLQEYKYQKDNLEKTMRTRKSQPQKAKKLLEDRDRAIAERIDQVVPENEIGLLFIGAAHDVVGKLAEFPSQRSFKIVHLLNINKELIRVRPG